VERSFDGEPWQVIAYRPRREEKVSTNPAAWHDGMAPRGLPLGYRVRATNWNDDSAVVSPATAAVTVPGETAELRQWQEVHFSEAEIAAGLAVPEADAESVPDGVPNLIEFALGMDPRAADAHLAAIDVSITETAGEENLSLVFRRNPEATDIRFLLLTSRVGGSLDWQAKTPTVERAAGTAPDGMPLHEFRLPVSGPHVFARVMFLP